MKGEVMNAGDSVLQRALAKMLNEIFNGPPGSEAYVLNPGDPGLLGQLESLSADAASTRPMPGKTTIAAHVDHVRFGISLMNRWVAGEPNPWADADWNASWRRTAVSDAQWRALRTDLRREADAWRNHVAARTEWDDVAASGALSTAAHTAYHLGAIRQIVAALKI
jgi:DinB family protein